MTNILQSNSEHQQLENRHYRYVRSHGAEGVLFLKRNHDFPIQKGKIALYGPGVRHTTICGTGGGIVNVKKIPTIEEAMIRKGFEIRSLNWLNQYDETMNQAKDTFFKKSQGIIKVKGFAGLGEVNGRHFQEPDYNFEIKAECDCALYVLTRLSGEGVDRTASKGDLYLTDTEIRDIRLLAKTYKKFMLVLNCSGYVDLEEVVDDVDNILYLSQPGIATGDILVDLICGNSYPSGKLSATYGRYKKTKTLGTFGQKDDADYKEGIYVGYRYYDSVGLDPLFPFGFGLSYTDFEIRTTSVALNRSILSIETEVKNIGSFKGKEVVQAYVSVPCQQLDQPYQVLAAFEKTAELKPNATQHLTLCFDLKDLRSFDEKRLARVLEKGDYIIRVGNSSRNTEAVAVVRIDETVICEKVHDIGGKADFNDFVPMKRSVSAETGLPILVAQKKDLQYRKPAKYKVSAKAAELAESLSNEELSWLLKGGYYNEGFDNPQYTHGIQVAGQVGFTTYRLEEKGINSVCMSDGPAGLHIANEYYEDELGVYPKESPQNLEFKAMVGDEIYEAIKKTYLEFNTENRHGVLKEHNCTNIPIGMSLAQSWNKKLAYGYGKLIAEEMKEYGIHAWFGPGVNIMRHVLCGRNFEYLSEDPLLTGKIAARIIEGSKVYGNYCGTPKHFCCNNQETARPNNSSNLSQRALRDIYVRAFEIIIKEADPYAIMASYNLVNGIHSCERQELMETLLRDEWGFKGMVMTDWLNPEEVDGFKYDRFKAPTVIKAGCDIMMPGTAVDCQRIREALDSGLISREQAVRNAARIIEYCWHLRG